MRVKLKKQERNKLFNKIIGGGSLNEAALKIGISRKTLSDWRGGLYTIPEVYFRKLLNIACFKQEDFFPKLYTDHWHSKKSGRKGGLVVFSRYGNIGTVEGRKKGGLASLATHKKKRTAFYNIKTISKPKYSEKLAELMGIFFGDGHLSRYQASITTNSVTDKEHASFVQNLIEKIFNDKPSLKVRTDERSIVIVLSSKAASKYLHQLGMPMGNKIKANIAVPSWVINSKKYSIAFLRGLFDTDGCIYLDRHKINGKIYLHLGWVITSYSRQLRKDIVSILTKLGFLPTNRATQTSVFLRRQAEIKKYFMQIKTSNSKHLMRYQKFIGEVPKWL